MPEQITNKIIPKSLSRWLLLLAVLMLIVDAILHWTEGSIFTDNLDYFQKMVWFPKTIFLTSLFALIISIVSLIKETEILAKRVTLLVVLFSLGFTLLSLIGLTDYHKVEEWPSPSGATSAVLYMEDPHEAQISIITLKVPNKPEITVFVKERTDVYVSWLDESTLEVRSNGDKIIHAISIKKPVPYIDMSEQDPALRKELKNITEQLQAEVDELKTNESNDSR